MNNREMSVLVVDDDDISVDILSTLLGEQGYKVLIASNGPDARRIAQLEQPGIILLDVFMAGEDGFEVCQKLKQSSTTADIPVVFISGMTDLDSRIKGLAVGGIDYISKPFHVDEVLARVKNYLKLRHAYLRVIEEQANRLQQIQDAQQAILVKPEHLPSANFGVTYQPVAEAGGDFYDVFEISSSVYGYFLADISGHDLGASFATSALKALIRQNSSPLYTPDETIRMINSVLMSIFSDGQHLTAAYVCVDQTKSLLYLVNAAHLPVLFFPQESEPIWLEADGDVLGVFESAQFNCQKIQISGGERFFIYSDGLLESFEGNKRTREQGMVELLEFAKDSRKLEIQKAVDKISEQMFLDGREMEDDVILLGVEIPSF